MEKRHRDPVAVQSLPQAHRRRETSSSTVKFSGTSKGQPKRPSGVVIGSRHDNPSQQRRGSGTAKQTDRETVTTKKKREREREREKKK